MRNVSCETYEVGVRHENITRKKGENGESIQYFLFSDDASRINLPEEANCLDISHCAVRELNVPGHVYMVSAWLNKNLEKVTIADSNNDIGFTDVYVSDNNLKELNLGKGTRIAAFSDNQLESIELPEGCEIVKAKNNKFKELNLPESCKYVDVSYNKNMEKLDVPEGCQYVIMNYTSIKETHIPKGCVHFDCTGTRLDMEKSTIHPEFKGKFDGLEAGQIKRLQDNYNKTPPAPFMKKLRDGGNG